MYPFKSSEIVKKFRDSVHGYISVPQALVKNIIDTELFQRLGNIEQTGIRVLFRSARHDRFIHSLGVYHLGMIAFRSICNSAMRELETLEEDLNIKDLNWWKKTEFLFAVSCLLHDIAHAPFSHTLEFVYDTFKCSAEEKEAIANAPGLSEEVKEFFQNNNLSKLDYMVSTIYGQFCELNGEFNNHHFINDYIHNDKGIIKSTGKEHERLAAVVINNYYIEPIKKALSEWATSLLDEEFNSYISETGRLTRDDYEFISRAIIGCPYHDSFDSQEHGKRLELSIKNCIISILNNTSFGIDVDNLDYTVRDSTNAGFDNLNIDYERFLNSMIIIPVYKYNDCAINFSNQDPVWFPGTEFVEIEGQKTFDLSENPLIVTQRLDVQNASVLIGFTTGRMSDEQVPYEFRLGFTSACLSLFEGIMNARNNLYRWIYSHHKVVYSTHFLKSQLLFLASKYFCCKKHKNEEGFKMKMLDCIDGECPLYDSDVEDLLADDFFMAEILGLKSFLSSRSDDMSSNLGEGQFKTVLSNDSDIEYLYKRIAIENRERKENKSDIIDRYWKIYSNRGFDTSFWKTKYELIHSLGIQDDRDYDDWFSLVDPDPALGDKRSRDTLFKMLNLTEEAPSSSKSVTNFMVYEDDDPVCEELKAIGIINPVLVLDKSNCKSLRSDNILISLKGDVDILSNYIPETSCDSFGISNKPYLFLYGTLTENHENPSIKLIIKTLQKAARQRQYNQNQLIKEELESILLAD